MKYALVFLTLCGMSGCLSANAATAVPENKAPDFAELLDDAESHSRQPALPDDLKKPEGSLPPAAASVDRSQPNTVPQPTGESDPDAAQLPVILIYGPKTCEPCKLAVAQLNQTARYDSQKSPTIPAWVEKVANEHNQGRYPIASFKDRQGVDRWVVWMNIRDFDQRYIRTMKERAAVSMTLPEQSTAAPFNATQFVQEWQIRTHLVRDHGFTQSQVAAMTDQQVIDAHNAAHQVWSGVFGNRPGRLARKGKL